MRLGRVGGLRAFCASGGGVELISLLRGVFLADGGGAAAAARLNSSLIVGVRFAAFEF